MIKKSRIQAEVTGRVGIVSSCRGARSWMSLIEWMLLTRSCDRSEVSGGNRRDSAKYSVSLLPLQVTSMHLSNSLQTASRTYLYDLSIHGALFLSSTLETRRASITAYRDPNFLRTFYTRLRRNEEGQELRREGYEWISHCQGESNFLRPALDGSAIVFDDLVKGGESFYNAT